MHDLPFVPGVTHRDVQAGDVRLHVAEAGEGDPVVLLHGWPQHWYCWRGVIPALSERYRVLCPDLRGFGWSATPGHGYDPPTFAADTVALLDALEIERAHVIGHDWGGYTSFLLGLHHAERVRRIVAVNTPHPWPPVDWRMLDALWRTWYVLAMAAPGLGPWLMRRGPAFVGLILRADNVHPEAMSDEAVETFAARLALPRRAWAASRLYRAYLRTFIDLLGAEPEPRLTVPLRLLFGAQDFAISKHLLRGYEEHADDMEIEWVEDSGHFLPEERPDLVTARALEFFA